MQSTKLKVLNTALVAIAAAGGAFAYTSLGPPSVRNTASSETRTATVGVGTVMTTISSSGNVTAPNDIAVNFATSGKLTELDVKVGETVREGQLLARVDSTSAKANLEAAQAQLASAKAKLTELEQGATSLVKQGIHISEAQAQQQVNSAQTALDNAQQNLTLDQTEQATALQQAQQQLAADEATYVHDESSLGAAVTAAQSQAAQQYSIDLAQGNADNVQLANDKAAQSAQCGPPALAGCAAANAAVAKDQVAIANDTARLATDGDGTPANSAAAINAANNETSTLARDQAAIDKDRSAITNGQNDQAATRAKDNQAIKNAQQQLTNAELSLQSLQNSDAQKTAPPQTSDVESAEASVEQAQAQVDTAQQTLDATSLTAPADGSIGAINASVGQTVSASSGPNSANSSAASSSSGFITLTNLTELQMVANIDEADASKVAVGAPATVTLNAVSGKQFAAHVIAVADSATVSSNVVQYQVTFSLDNTDPAIKPGMTADVSVTTGKADGVLNVSSAAVRTAAGTSYVMVMQPNGTQKRVDVVVGLKGDSTTEIDGPVKSGDIVTLPTSTVSRSTTSTTSNNNSGRGGFGGGGGVFIPGGGFGGRG
jgi:RND family efflux transporter MFP subunit